MDPFKLAEFNEIQALSDFLHPDSLNMKNAEGNTILMIACKAGHYGLAKICLEKGADRNITNNLGLNAYQISFEAKKTLIMKLFCTI